MSGRWERLGTAPRLALFALALVADFGVASGMGMVFRSSPVPAQPQGEHPRGVVELPSASGAGGGSDVAATPSVSRVGASPGGAGSPVSDAIAPPKAGAATGVVVDAGRDRSRFAGSAEPTREHAAVDASAALAGGFSGPVAAVGTVAAEPVSAHLSGAASGERSGGGPAARSDRVRHGRDQAAAGAGAGAAHGRDGKGGTR